MKLEHEPAWEELSVNHLEGHTAALFGYGYGGGDEIGDDGRPRKLRHKAYFDPREEPFENDRDAFAPLVWQCRYSGIEVADEPWVYCEFGEGKKYSDNQAEDIPAGTWGAFDRWCDSFAAFAEAKGKLSPGRFRAFGYEPPAQRWADMKLAWRSARIATGHPPHGSSPERQQDLGLNDDRTLRPKAGE
jgi:hypothetical protein